MRRQAILGRPLAGENMLHGAAAWASWALDGLLTLLAAGTIIYLACRAPYCPLCRSWYRTIRAGPLTAGRAARLAHAASLGSEEPAGTGQYRLSHCVGGCGPGKLEMACSGWQKNRVAEAWLSAVQRAEVVRVLDEPRE